ncbi:MAG: hypothetical protein RL141_690 [Candidatus Parcubacteria bacterium]|jgi:hypothetical protein
MLRNALPALVGRQFDRSFRHVWMSALFVGALFAASFFVAPDLLAQTAESSQAAQQVANAAGIGNAPDLYAIIGRIIAIFFSVLGIIFLVLLLYAGFLWMTAQGDGEKVETAQKLIRNAVIGLIIIASSWAIARFVLNALVQANGGGGGIFGSGSGEPGGGFQTGAGSLGGGIIESHLPPRNAVDVPRNTAIIVTFRAPVRIASIIQGYDDHGTPETLADDTATEGLNDAAVKIYRTDAGVETALASDRVRVRVMEDRRTFVFKPVELLGNPNGHSGYTVELKGGRDGVLLEDGDVGFGGAFASGYTWQFEVGTTVDLTPPRVVAVTPRAGNQYAPNIVVQLTFNEAIDPTSATGLVQGGQGFQNIRTHAGEGTTAPLDGRYRISNQYRTVEFIPASSCGRNACGREMFCLPGGTSVAVVAQAATLDGEGPAAQFTQSGYDGVVDVTGNSLDGNGDRVAQGARTDDYSWTFGTSDDVNREPPMIEATMPPAESESPGRSNVDRFAPVTARFDTLLQYSSVSTEHAQIVAREPAAFADTFWWSTDVETLTGENEPVEGIEDLPVKSEVRIAHRPYASSTAYDPVLNSGIQDLYQNCFNPAAGPGCPEGPGGPNCCQGTRQTDRCEGF